MRISRRGLLTALSPLARLAGPRGDIHIHNQPGLLTLSACNGATELTYMMEAKGPALNLCLPARLLFQLVKSARAPAVDIDAQGLALDGVRVKLPLSPESDRPERRDWKLAVECSAAAWQSALKFVLPAASTDSTRSSLFQLLVEQQQLVASDGHRLHLAPLPCQLNPVFGISVLAAKTLLRVLTGADMVRVGLSIGAVRFHVGPWLLDTPFSEAPFPDYRQVIPHAQTTHLCVDSQELCSALKQLRPLSVHVGLRVNGVLQLDAKDLASVVVPTLSNDHQGPDLVTHFDTKYLLDALGTGPVNLGLGNALSALSIHHDDQRTAVIMPVRV